MKKFNNKKSVIEQGGLMIEALAMLGLIAVVTPTMYKKSAERTMEVEDINTASAIRTYMNGVESLLAANYSELMEKIPEPAGDNPTIVSLDDLELTVPGSDEAGSDTVKAMDELEKYLPYGYSAKDNLYNYGQPSFAVARSGNNLSAFMVFPARGGDEEETIGQERTVRIASLIGSNGGYVREGEARGVGGTWNLTSDELSSIAGSTPGNYSIVTSSIDVVNGAEGMGGDMTKYLQRTAENGEIEKWRNTMRTDIYMGELANKGHDYDDKTTDGYFSIRNINQLIVGADGSDADNDKGWEKASDRDSLYVNEKYQTSNGEGAEGEEGDADVKRGLESYGLYIADATDDTRGKYGINAYIAGSLEAAGKRLFTDENELTYHGPKIQLGGIDEDETTGTATKYLITAVTEKLESEEEVQEGMEAPEGRNRVEIMPVSKGDSGDAPLIIASDSDLEEVRVGDRGATGTKLLLAKAGDKTIDGSGADTDNGYTTEDASNAPKISYDTGQPAVPQFPVVVDSNMAVNGVLAAGQLDTQKIRVAELAVGSPNINDRLKWMEVDEDGVHIHSRDGAEATDDGEGNTTPAKALKQVEINDDVIAMRFGSTAQDLNTNENPTKHETQFIMNDSGVKIIAQGTDGEAATGHSIELTTGTKGVRERLEKNEITIGSPTSADDETGEGGGNSPYRVKYEEGGYVDMIGTTLQVTDSAANPVFTIRGNDTEESGLVGGNYNDPTTYKTSNTDTNGKFKIAGHGDTVFTSDAVSRNNENKAVKFLAMGVKSSGEDKGIDDQYNAGVNIVSDSDTAGNNSKRVVYIDLENGSSQAYVGAPKGWENTSGSDNSFDSFELDNKTGGKRTMAQGTVYIRKGLIDIAPNRSDYTGGEEPKGNASADTSSGTVRASRFVANNVNIKGERIMYNNTLNDSDYQSGVSNKYDTYMVNPAYTSVMKDIKLTSRFGARLSDILPDFITKRIYYSTNSYSEGTDYKELSGDEGDRTPESEGTSPYASPYLGSIPAPSCPPGYGRAITVVPGSFEMATVGTLEPAGADRAGLDVSQAAMLGLKVDATNPGAYVQSDDGVVETNYTSKAEFLENQPVFGRIRDLEQGSIEKGSVPAQLQTTRGSAENDGGKWEPDLVQFYQNSKGPEDDGDEENRLFLIGGVARVGVDRDTLKSDEAVFHENSHVDLRDQTLYIDHFGYNTRSTGADRNAIKDNKGLALRADVVADKYVTKYNSSGKPEPKLAKNQSVSETDEGAYFLVTNDPNQRPISFQKSTWLKTAFKELATHENTGYVNGWAVLTGFIYPVELYGNVANVLGVTKKDDYNDDGDAEIDGYWNLFPVLKNTLTSYSTTYCFIDNKVVSETDNDSVTGTVNWDDDGSTENAGNIQYTIDDWNTDYSAPHADERKVLNDPALKYDELW